MNSRPCITGLSIQFGPSHHQKPPFSSHMSRREMVTFGAISATSLRLLLESKIPRPGKKRIRLRRQATRMVTQIFPSASMNRYPDHISTFSPEITIYVKKQKYCANGSKMLKYPAFPSTANHPMTYDPYEHALQSDILPRSFFFFFPFYRIQ